MHILLTNTWMISRSGSEEVVRDYATFFKEHGHTVSVFAPTISADAQSYFASLDICITDHVDGIVTQPDIIHGHHITAFLEVMERFPGVPVVQWIHGTFGSWDLTVTHPDVVHYLGVDNYRCGRVLRDGVAVERVNLAPNTTDIKRFKLTPLDTNSRRALCISRGPEDIAAIERACAATGWELEVIGRGVGREVSDIEEVIARNSLVITTARCAIESIAMGRSVLVCDFRCLGDQVTLENWSRYRAGNIDLPATWRPFSEDGLVKELGRIDLAKGVQLSVQVRDSLAVAAEAAKVEALYERLVAAHTPADAGVHGWRRDLLRVVKGLPRFQTGWRPTEEDRIAARLPTAPAGHAGAEAPEQVVRWL